MIEGIFKFYQDNKLIAESRNNITETGRILAIKTLLGALPSFGSSLAIGVDSTPNTLSTISYTPTQVVVTGTTAVTATFSSHSFLPGDIITVSGVTATGLTGINGTQTVTSITTTTISFTDSALTAGTYNTNIGTFSKSSGLATETQLGFEIASTRVSSSHLASSYLYDGLVFKGTLSDPSSYRFIEAGLYADPLISGTQNYKSETLTSFEAGDSLETTAGAELPTSGDVTRLYTSADSSNFRIGDSCLQVKVSGSAKINQQFFGIEKYLNTDLISLAFYSEGSSTVNVDFYSNAAYKRYSYTGVIGYNVGSIEKGSPSSTSGTGFDWSNITSIEVSATGTDVLLDAIKLKVTSRLDTNNGLISRTVLPDVITKLSNTPLEIEYYLRLGFNV
jgi:hypothetical protein